MTKFDRHNPSPLAKILVPAGAVWSGHMTAMGDGWLGATAWCRQLGRVYLYTGRDQGESRLHYHCAGSPLTTGTVQVGYSDVPALARGLEGLLEGAPLSIRQRPHGEAGLTGEHLLLGGAVFAEDLLAGCLGV